MAHGDRQEAVGQSFSTSRIERWDVGVYLEVRMGGGPAYTRIGLVTVSRGLCSSLSPRCFILQTMNFSPLHLSSYPLNLYWRLSFA